MTSDTKECPVPRFREARLNAGLTQNDAAHRLGKTGSAVQKWETGANSPTMADIYRMADLYGTTPSSFFVESACEATDTTTLHRRVNRLERAVRAAMRGLNDVIGNLQEALVDDR
jgi:transcriptional regulator with XRE-family HTH domain